MNDQIRRDITHFAVDLFGFEDKRAQRLAFGIEVRRAKIDEEQKTLCSGKTTSSSRCKSLLKNSSE